MSIDRSFVELNRQSTERMRDIERLSDEELLTPVGQHWTVAIMMAHLAFWDRRVLWVLDMTEREGKLVVPDVGIEVNDLSLPLWAAIPARAAVRLGIETAETLDGRLERFPEPLLEEIYQYNKRWVVRALHRDGHLDEAADDGADAAQRMACGRNGGTDSGDCCGYPGVT